MPCERKHIEAIEVAMNALGEASIRGTDETEWTDVWGAINAALAACDESPCVWAVGPSSGDFIPGCSPATSSAEAGWRYAWSAGFVKSMTYCPHCGRKIAPLPAAPEVGK